MAKKRNDKILKLSEIVDRSAKAKGLDVNEFIKEKRQAVETLREGFTYTINKAIDDIPPVIEAREKGSNVVVNGEDMNNIESIFELENYRNRIKRLDNSIMQIMIDFTIDLDGNIAIDLPDFDSDDFDEAEADEIVDFFKQFGITIIISDRTKNPDAKNRLKRKYTYKPKKKK